MIGKDRLQTKIPTLHYIQCPDCNKKRLLKQETEEGGVPTVSEDTVEVRGETRYSEACPFCLAKYKRSDDNFVMQNLRKIQKAMHAPDINKEDSDHTDFTLDL